jgi:hypothetical protein
MDAPDRPPGKGRHFSHICAGLWKSLWKNSALQAQFLYGIQAWLVPQRHGCFRNSNDFSALQEKSTLQGCFTCTLT